MIATIYITQSIPQGEEFLLDHVILNVAGSGTAMPQGGIGISVKECPIEVVTEDLSDFVLNLM